MQWPDLITALVAVYGAALSTWTHIARHREKQRRIVVTVSVGFLVFERVGPGPTALFITASNPGSRTVSLNSPGILLPNQRKLVFPFGFASDASFPCDLREGKSCQMWISTEELADDLKNQGFSGKIKLRGYYRDALGALHKSRPYEFEIDKWRSSPGGGPV